MERRGVWHGNKEQARSAVLGNGIATEVFKMPLKMDLSRL